MSKVVRVPGFEIAGYGAIFGRFPVERGSQAWQCFLREILHETWVEKPEKSKVRFEFGVDIVWKETP